MKLKVDLKILTQYIFLYIMLMLHGAIYWSNVYDQTFLPICIIIAAVVFLSFYFKVSLPDIEFIITMAVFSAFFLLSGILHSKDFINGLDIKPLLFIWANIIIANLAYKLDRKEAPIRFIRLLSFFAIISLLVYVFCMFGGAPVIQNTLPGFRPTAGTRTYYGKYLFSVLWSIHEQDGYRRNIGIFYEPGVYQIVLNAAIFIILFCRDAINEKNKTVNLYLILFILTVLSTGSTTGYLGLAFMFIGFVMQSSGKNAKTIKIIVVLFVCLIALDYIKNGEASLVQNYIFNKFEGTTGDISDMRGSSGGARMIVFAIAIAAMKKNPLFGIGNTAVELQLEKLWGKRVGAGNILCSYIAKKGLAVILIFLTALLRLAWKNKRTVVSFLVFAALYVNTAFAQAQLAYGVFIFIAMLEKADILNNNLEDEKELEKI